MRDDKVENLGLAQDLFGKFKTVTAAPTEQPINFLDQIRIYTNGSTYRLYWYDATNKTWHFVTATA